MSCASDFMIVLLKMSIKVLQERIAPKPPNIWPLSYFILYLARRISDHADTMAILEFPNRATKNSNLASYLFI